jgi:signal transduction histidine kinase
MKRTVLIWISFGTCLTVVLAAMGWISLTAVRLEQAQNLAQRRAALEENVRLALWRMDSTLLPFIGQESARSHEAYQPFVSVPQAFTSAYTLVEWPVLLPSPLLSNDSPFVVCYFQYDADGELTSPQVPRAEVNEAAQRNNDVTESQVTEAGRHLKALAEFTSRDALLQILPAGTVTAVEIDSDGEYRFEPVNGQEPGLNASAEIQTARTRSFRQSVVEQQRLNANEFRLRTRNTIGVNNGLLLPNRRLRSNRPNIRIAALHPLWIGDRLLLARRVLVDGNELVQGVWLDWPAIRSSLLSDVRDLLPSADLAAIHQESPGEESRMLATIPARIVPGALPEAPLDGWSPIRVSLLIAWLCTISAALLGAMLLAAVVSLSERRAAFVSAVTHELRTPLTTFQLYTEMLQEGLVSDEQQRNDYLRILRTEADRLGHLVENVLAYARLDRSRQPVHLEEILLSELIDRVVGRLRQRTEQSRMKLMIAGDVYDPPVTVRVDPSAVERILINLVDNACKYASSATNRTVELSCRRRDSQVQLRIRDFGPGTGLKVKKRLFRLFSKSARDAANSKPGVGLGLALSRALARKLGGDLRLDSSVTDGACFLLTLPITNSTHH